MTPEALQLISPQEAEQHRKTEEKKPEIKKTRVILPEDKIDTDELQKDNDRVFALMRAVEESSDRQAKVSRETLDLQLTKKLAC